MKPTLSTEMLIPVLLVASGADPASRKIAQSVVMDVRVGDSPSVVEGSDWLGRVVGTGVSVT